MSENNIAKNGQVLGSSAYFEELNKNCVMRGIFTDCRDYHYVDQLEAFSERIKGNLIEIYDDLKSYSRVLPYLPDEHKKELAKFIKNVDDAHSALKTSTTKAYDCITLLELRDYSTRPKSNADFSKIRDVADEIQRERYFSLSDIVEILRKAKDYGIRDASSDTAKIIYVTELCGEDKDFYDDVLLLLYYRNRLKHFEGKCGKAVCSKDYLEYYKSKIFTFEIPLTHLYGNDNYADSIKQALDGIFEEIKADIETSNACLSVEYINKLKSVSDDFEKLIGKGFSDKLDTEITGLSNIDGLLLDRDFEVLSDDDLAVVKALNNEYLYYEQKQDKAIMEAIGYEIVKIRQKDIYFDMYNPGPFVNRSGHKPNDNIKVLKSVLGTGDVWLLGGKTTETEILETIRSFLSVGKVGALFDFLLFVSSLDKVVRARACLEIGDIRIQVQSQH